MEHDKANTLKDELTEMHIMTLYDLLYPNTINTDSLSRRDDAIMKYRNDSVFNSMVKTMVYRTMDIVEKYCGEQA